jgi:glycosyltransferase 2 family protein
LDPRGSLATRRGRRFASTRLLKALRSAYASLRQVAASPAKLALLIGGSALVTLAYIGGLAAALQAFGGGIGIAEIGAVYIAASAIAAASPTPGGLGAIEAALVAGLTGVGLGSGAARCQPSSPTGWPRTGCRWHRDGSP